MIPQAFEYSVPHSLQEALQLVEDGERKILAGGMSLIPLMKLRLATPSHVVDLNRIAELRDIREDHGALRIGALATHHAVESSPLVRGKCPLLSETASHIGDVQVRNMGTVGGSVAHADPAADYPAALLALEAEVFLANSNAGRSVAASDFFVDAFTTAIEPGEMVLDLQVPVEEPSEGFAYQKLAHPASGFAVVGVAVRIRKSGGKVSLARIGVTGMAPRAFRALDAEKALEAGASPAEAVATLGANEEANSDLYASADYRKHLARVHAVRAIEKALARAS
jgi:carbon-monoxide dehydrogenase medium subunit